MQDIGDYEFWGISAPAEDVGGDFFDFPLEDVRLRGGRHAWATAASRGAPRA
jgi:hypothetical protein